MSFQSKFPAATALLLTALLRAPAAVAASPWSTKTPFPAAVGDAMAVGVDGVLYAGGGTTGSALSAFYKYDVAADTWVALASFPAPRYQGSLAADGGKIYLIGGWTVSPSLPNSTVYSYDIAAGTWSQVASLPRLSGCGTSVAIGGKVYTTIPCNGFSGYYAYVYAYDPAGNSWTALTDSPHGHSVGAGAAIDGKLYVAGGLDTDGSYTATLDVYDPVASSWTTKASMAAPRAAMSGAALDGKFYVVGGQNSSGTPVSTVEVYDPASDSWSAVDALPTARANLAVAEAGGAVWTVGGNAGGRTRVVEVYRPAISSAAFTGVFLSSLTAHWTSTYSSGTLYDARLSSGSWPNSFSGNLSSVTANLSALFTGLTPGSTYFARVSTSPGGAFVDLGSAVLLPAVSTRASAWVTKTPYPVAASDLVAVGAGGVLYAGGGTTGSAVLTNFYKYDVVSDTWVALASFPAPRYQGAMAADAGKIYLIGGWTLSPALPNSTVYSYDVAAGTWSQVASLPRLAGCEAAAAIGGKIYTTIPCNGFSGYYSYFYAYDPGANAWTSLPDSPHGHTGGAGAAIGGKLYVAGGQDTDGSYTAALDVYDPVAGSWTSKAAMPAPRGGMSGTTLGGKLFVVGGQNSSGTPVTTAAVYDPVSDSWGAIDALPTARSNLAVAEAGGTIWTVGGYAGGRSRVVEAYGSALSSAAFTGVFISSLTAHWTSTYSPGTLYDARLSTGAWPNAFSGNLSSVTANLSALFTGLTPGSTYFARVSTSPGGAFVDLGSAVLLPAVSIGVRAEITVPQNGKRIKGNRVTVVAGLIAGAPAETRQVLFQFKPSTASAWADIPPAEPNHPNPETASPYLVHWDVTALATGAYDLRAVATNLSGQADAFPPTIALTVDPVNYDIDETDLGGGRVQKSEVVSNSTTSLIQAGDGNSAQLTTISIPPSAVSASTVSVAVINNPSGVPAPPKGAAALGAAVQITLSNGQSQLSNGQSASVTLSYADADGDGLVDGTPYRADRLVMESYDSVSGSWREDLSSTVDLTARTVTGRTRHFSLFTVFAAASSDLSAVRVYPNPFRPNGGQADRGVAYDPANGNSGIVFDGLPQSVTVEIYSLSGRLVRRLSSDATSGKLQWDAKNGDGRDAASGGYVAVFKSPGLSPVTKRILILR